MSTDQILVSWQSARRQLSINPVVAGCRYFTPGQRLLSQPKRSCSWPVPNYTAWSQRHTGVSSLNKATMQLCPARTQLSYGHKPYIAQNYVPWQQLPLILITCEWSHEDFDTDLVTTLATLVLSRHLRCPSHFLRLAPHVIQLPVVALSVVFLTGHRTRRRQFCITN